MSFTSAGIIKALLECFGLDVSWPALVIPVGAAVQSQSRPPPAELDFMESLGHSLSSKPSALGNPTFLLPFRVQ